MRLNRRQTLAAALAGGAVAALPGLLRAQAAQPTPATDFLTPIEHSSLILTLGGQVIVVDPVGAADRYGAAATPAAVLVTHEHGDHFDADTLAALVPMNLPYTMSVDQAVAGVAEMAPRVVVPYHHTGNDPAEFAEKLRATGAATETLVLDWYPATDDPRGPAD